MGCKYPTPTYNRRVTFQSPAGTRDTYGERTTTWTDVATVWSAVMPLTVRELIAGGGMQGEITHKVQVRYTATLAASDASWRIKFGTRYLVLIGPPRNIFEGNRVLEFMCAEGLVEE